MKNYRCNACGRRLAYLINSENRRCEYCGFNTNPADCLQCLNGTRRCPGEAVLLPNIGTPWGYSQSHIEISEGISKVTTASHGGYHLDPERWNDFKLRFPDFQPYAGASWFEEDCDAVAVVLAFPQSFEDKGIFFAVQMIDAHSKLASHNLKFGHNASDRGWSKFKEWLESAKANPADFPVAARINERAASFFEAHKDHWELRSAGTRGKGWCCEFVKLGDPTQHRNLELKGYPVVELYTDEDLASLVVDPIERFIPEDAPVRNGEPVQTYKEWEESLGDRSDAPDVDATGQCYSDADPGL